jgi:sugar phosphate isomerase/epimerase
MRNTISLFSIVAGAIVAAAPAPAAEPPAAAGVFAKPNLVAWCIVPFDAARRGPQQRAEMLSRLGIRRFAYDWRAEHVPTFEEEILQLRRQKIELFAFWDFQPAIVPLVAKYGVRPQFWVTVPSPAGESREQKVEAAARQLLPLVRKTRELGCKLGLYNHGGWGGEPENMVAVARRLRQDALGDQVGIVYNFHHGHGHIRDFAQALSAMRPYLLCINLNGMNEDERPKILPVGSGRHERAMMETIRRSGYDGPIGILGHRENVDAEESLRQNLDGMKKVLKQMGDDAALATYE